VFLLGILFSDRLHEHHASLLKRDLNIKTEKEEDRPLPPNNPKQQEAIDKAMMSKFTLIQGPPGKLLMGLDSNRQLHELTSACFCRQQVNDGLQI